MIAYLRKPLGGKPLGVWLALAGVMVPIVVGGGGQALSLLNWDTAIALGFQENDPASANIVDRVLSHIEWGTCAADILFVVPLFVLGVLAIICRRFWGVLLLFMGMATWFYMFLAYTFGRYSLVFRGDLAPWSAYGNLVLIFGLMVVVPFVLVVVGLGANVDRFTVFPPPSHRLSRVGDRLPRSFLEDLIICVAQVLRAAVEVWVLRKRNWNCTPKDLNRSMASDKMVKKTTVLNRAISIDQSIDKVWPWVAQYGRGAAYYSWDFLDNVGHEAATYVLDSPDPAVGDKNDEIGEIRHVENKREIVWVDQNSFMKVPYSSAMSLFLESLSDNQTRLHFRYTIKVPKNFWGRVAIEIVALMDHVMCTEMLKRLKLLIETYDDRKKTGEMNKDRAPHQKHKWRPVTNPKPSVKEA